MRLVTLLPLLIAVWLPALPAAAANPPAAMLTIVDGDAQIIRESLRFNAVEGLRLEPEDIVHTAEGARVLRVEFGDGSSVDLGPATRVQWQPRLAAESGVDRPARLYASGGWLKLTRGGAALTSARVDVADVTGATVMRITDDAIFAFVESGSLRLVERSAGRAPVMHALNEGTSYTRQADEAGTVAGRPAGPLLQALPRAFTDSLPMRAARFQEQAIAPGATAEIGYADVAPWINGERALRYGFVQRWRGKAREPQFRNALVAELAAHPEWDRTLFPEKYAAPKPRPVTKAPPGHTAPQTVATSVRAPLFAPELLPLTSAPSLDRSPRMPTLPRQP